jgi:hypothetical protein
MHQVEAKGRLHPRHDGVFDSNRVQVRILLQHLTLGDTFDRQQLTGRPLGHGIDLRWAQFTYGVEPGNLNAHPSRSSSNTGGDTRTYLAKTAFAHHLHVLKVGIVDCAFTRKSQRQRRRSVGRPRTMPDCGDGHTIQKKGTQPAPVRTEVGIDRHLTS